MRTDHTLGAPAWAFSVWVLIAFFVLNLAGMIATVALDSIGTHWFRTWLPAGWTLRWYGMVWNEFQLPPILVVTVEVVAAVVFLSGLIGVPAAYAMTRRDFPGKRPAMLLFLLPLLVPPITYGIPLAMML
jgi:putative spermidine/putrescine transport system permease protein